MLRYIFLNPVLDVVGLEPPEGAVHRGTAGLRPGVWDQELVHRLAGLVKVDAKLSDDLHLAADIFQRPVCANSWSNTSLRVSFLQES